jgi:hypothetical protein
MNREDIVRMAREADLVTWGFESLEWEPVANMEAIERFAALVASAAVRETSAEYRLGWNDGQIAEREDIIKLADDLYYWDDSDELIKAIRARGQA